MHGDSCHFQIHFSCTVGACVPTCYLHLQVPHTIFFQSHSYCPFPNNDFQTMTSCEKEMGPVAMTIINPPIEIGWAWDSKTESTILKPWVHQNVIPGPRINHDKHRSYQHQ